MRSQNGLHRRDPGHTRVTLWSNEHLRDLAAQVASNLSDRVYAADVVTLSVDELARARRESPPSETEEVAVCLGNGSAEDSILIEQLNRMLEASATPCLFLSELEDGLQVGPWADYGHTACWKCQDTIVAFFQHKPWQRGLAALDRHRRPPETVMAQLIAQNLLDVLSGDSALIQGRIFEISERESDLHFASSFALKDPTCDVCSRRARQPTETFYIQKSR